MIIDDVIFHLESVEDDTDNIITNVRELSDKLKLLQSNASGEKLKEVIEETNQGTAGAIDLLLLTRDRAKQSRIMLEIMRNNNLVF